MGNKNINLIIVDQLKFNYIKYFSKCRQILKYSALGSCNSIPTSTGPIHANVSTGMYPKDHGFVSKVTESGKTGIDDFLDSSFSTVSTSAASLGYDINVIGGKSEVVAIMSNPNHCSISLSLNLDKKHLGMSRFGIREDITSDIWKKYTGSSRFSSLDEGILSVWNEIQSELPDNNQFWVITLPELDYVGHRYGPDSSNVAQHLENIDAKIAGIISKSDANTILLGDHGCRRVKRYIVEDATPNQAILYEETTDNIVFKGRFAFWDTNVRNIQFEGGILRIKCEPGHELNMKDKKELSRFGCVVPYSKHASCLTARNYGIYSNSLNKNLYDAIVIADDDVIFCKRNWMSAETHKHMRNRKNLKIGSLPIGEHGTYHADDNNVLILSNCQLPSSEIYNVHIKDLILNLPI